MLDARSAVTQRDAVRTRLGDERIWSAEHAAELRSLIQILVALGDRRWVFSESERRRAWEVPALRPLVTRFELYDPTSGRTRFEPEEVEEAGFWEDYGAFSVIKIVARSLWIVVRDGLRGRIYVNPFYERLGVRRFALSEAQASWRRTRSRSTGTSGAGTSRCRCPRSSSTRSGWWGTPGRSTPAASARAGSPCRPSSRPTTSRTRAGPTCGSTTSS
jgi:hypothetical protein